MEDFKMFPNGTTPDDDKAITEGIKHYSRLPHDIDICPACALRKVHQSKFKEMTFRE